MLAFCDYFRIFAYVDRVFHIYTDGVCVPHNGKHGSWAYVVVEGDTKVIEGSGKVSIKTTNIRMEMTAIMEAMIASINNLPGGKMILYSDCMVVVDGLNKWIDTWRELKWRTVIEEN